MDMNRLRKSSFIGPPPVQLDNCRQVPCFGHKPAYQGIGRVAAAIAIALLFCHPQARGQNTVDVTAWIQYLASQVKDLKAEMVACRLEMQEQTIALIERELVEIHKDQLQLQSEEKLLK